LTAGDHSFPPVLARTWHAAWIQNIGVAQDRSRLPRQLRLSTIARGRGLCARVAALDFGHSAVKDAGITSETSSVAKSGQESVVIASFDSYRHAEYMLASLRRGFRKKARKGGTTAVVVRDNPDGSLKVTESRVLSAGDFVYTVARVFLSVAVPFAAREAGR
jgi:hypothetical protein